MKVVENDQVFGQAFAASNFFHSLHLLSTYNSLSSVILSVSEELEAFLAALVFPHSCESVDLLLD